MAMTTNKQTKMRTLRFVVLFLELLAACTPDPKAGDFAAPKLGTVTVEVEAFRAWVSCPVSGSLAGVSACGLRFGDAMLREVPATWENGSLKAEIKGLRSNTDYHAEFFLTNGAETLTSEASFHTLDGPETVEIPDPVFRRYILANFDTNADEVLTVLEALTVSRIEVCTDSISSLRGIEKMERLQELIAQGNWSHGWLHEIDLSGNPLLRCCKLDDNQLHTVDLSANPLLEEFGIGGNPLLSIDFSHNPRLWSIGMNNVPLDYLPDMTFLPLESLHFDHVARFIPEDYFRHFPKMGGCNIGLYEGRHIDFSQCTQLNSVWCYGSPNLEELDLTASTCTVFDWIQAGDCPRLRHIYLRKGSTVNHLWKDDHTEIVYVE